MAGVTELEPATPGFGEANPIEQGVSERHTEEHSETI